MKTDSKSIFHFKLEGQEECPDIPVQDSPQTPLTPDILSDLTISSALSGLSRVSDISTRTKKYVGDKDPLVFQPSSLEEAREFLTRQAGTLQPRWRRSSPSETPVSSRTREMICHGCHGKMVQGSHVGSRPGKNICTLPHNLDCPGNILENDLWRACEQSLQITDYLQQHSSTVIQAQDSSNPPQLNFVTPQPTDLHRQGMIQIGQMIQQEFGQSFGQDHQIVPSPGIVQNSLQPQPISSQSVQPLGARPRVDPTLLPHHVDISHGNGAANHVHGSPSQEGAWDARLRSRGPGINYNEETAIDLSTVTPDDRGQEQVDALRASNQVANQAASRENNDFPFNINDVRADPGNRFLVQDRMQVIRSDLPSLSAAPSVPIGDSVPFNSEMLNVGLNQRSQTAPYNFTTEQLFQPPQINPRVQASPYQFRGGQLVGGHGQTDQGDRTQPQRHQQQQMHPH